MDYFFVFIVMIVIGVYLFLKSTNQSSTQNRHSEAEQASPEITPNNQVAVDALTRVAKACQEVGGDGFSSLIVAASADGKVSRDELRIVMWYCESFGAKFLDDDIAYVSKLNAGVNLSVNNNAGSPAKIVADCANLDLPSLMRLYAAHTSIGKPWNKTAKRSRETLIVLEKMISLKVSTKTAGT